MPSGPSSTAAPDHTKLWSRRFERWPGLLQPSFDGGAGRLVAAGEVLPDGDVAGSAGCAGPDPSGWCGRTDRHVRRTAGSAAAVQCERRRSSACRRAAAARGGAAARSWLAASWSASASWSSSSGRARRASVPRIENSTVVNRSSTLSPPTRTSSCWSGTTIHSESPGAMPSSRSGRCASSVSRCTSCSVMSGTLASGAVSHGPSQSVQRVWVRQPHEGRPTLVGRPQSPHGASDTKGCGSISDAVGAGHRVQQHLRGRIDTDFDLSRIGKPHVRGGADRSGRMVPASTSPD